MEHPDKAASRSVSPPGDLIEEPNEVIAVTVRDASGDAHGILEKWSSDAWIYADRNALMPIQ